MDLHAVAGSPQTAPVRDFGQPARTAVHRGFFSGPVGDRYALAAFRTLSNRGERVAFLRALCRHRSVTEPRGFITLALALHGTDRAIAVRTLLKDLPAGAEGTPAERLAAALLMDVAIDPSFSVATAIRLLPADAPTALLTPLLSAMARRDPAAVAPFVIALPPGSFTTAIQRIGTQWASRDTAAALVWADQLAAGDRTTARAAIQLVAPVGVGLALSTDAVTGYPVAAKTVPGSPAARSGAITAGDRIMAVQNGQDPWSSTDGQPLASVVGLIRGAAGQTVQLRVLPRGVTDLSQARTITLVREQVLLKKAGG